MRERKLRAEDKVLGSDNYDISKSFLRVHTLCLFFPAILSALSISIGPYQEEPNRKSKFRGEEWSGA